MTRTRRAEPLTTEEVVHTARILIQEHGVDACSMRVLAGELGVQPPALYRRVRDKDELLALVLADAFGDVRVPTAGTWQERVGEVMRRMRRLVRRQPHLLDLYLRSHLRDSDLTRLSIRGSAPLRDAGFSAEAATFALTVLAMYTLGMASVATSLDIDDEAMFEFGLARMIEGLTPGER
jgi:AcrR family transcriptional regulator